MNLSPDYLVGYGLKRNQSMMTGQCVPSCHAGAMLTNPPTSIRSLALHRPSRASPTPTSHIGVCGSRKVWGKSRGKTAGPVVPSLNKTGAISRFQIWQFLEISLHRPWCSDRLPELSQNYSDAATKRMVRHTLPRTASKVLLHV